MVTFTLEQGGTFTTMAIVAAVAILLTGVFYYRAFRNLRFGQWQLLLLLRSIAIIVIVILMFRPMFSYHKERTRKPGLIFLLDRSQSMSIADDASGLSRYTLAKQQVEKWFERLKDDFELHLMEFAEAARPLGKIEELNGIAPDGKSTSLSNALQSAADLLPSKEDKNNVEAIVLLSDGINNTKKNPLDIAGRLGTVVHTVGVGASLRANSSYRDIQVVGIDCPDRLMLKNKANLTALIDAIGLGGYVTKVILEEDGQVLGEKELTLDDVEGAQKVTFEITPTTKGRHTYTVRVPPAAEEKIIENNKRSIVVMVTEPGIRVLYVEGTLRAEYGALADRFLSKDPDLEFCALVQTKKNVFLKRTNIPNFDLNVIPTDPDVVNKFDVFLFGDLDSTFVKPEAQELIVKRVQDGAGIMMLGGYHSLGPGGYEGTPIGGILPMRLGNREIGQATDPFLPMLTPEGVQHPIFNNAASFFPTKLQPVPKAEGLPALNGCTRVEGARPGATILAIDPAEAGGMPVLAVQPVGKGRSAVFAADTTRNWQQGPRAFNQDSPFLQFWGQTIRWLAGRSNNVENEASLVASLNKGFYEPDEPVQIVATVRDQKGEATNSAQVEAKIVGPTGRPEKATLSLVAGPAGHYAGQFDPKDSGRYKIIVEAKLGELVLRSDELLGDVGRPNLEFEKLDLDEKMLTHIAADAGGRYMHISTADKLVDQLNKAQRKKEEYIEQALYWPPWMWALFIVVLTVEWVLRKRFQLR